jgi:hypothetical protein
VIRRSDTQPNTSERMDRDTADITSSDTYHPGKEYTCTSTDDQRDLKGLPHRLKLLQQQYHENAFFSKSLLFLAGERIFRYLRHKLSV